jgi:hypothetical protein
MPISSAGLAVLDRIEALEMRSLEWGFTDGSLSEDEAHKLAEQVCDTLPEGSHSDSQDLIEELIDAKVIFELPSVGGEIRIRSRFAEGIRLLVANRQLFPNKPWQGAPSLVSDFRVDCRPRRFPRRDLAPDTILTSQPEILSKTRLRSDLWHALTEHPGMKLSAFQARATVRLAEPTDDGGTIVTAGTGSGKTISFYLPGMIRVSEAVNPDRWVKAIAIYPRIELLKDQFSEAYQMARSLDATLSKHGRRPIVVGALFGATPSRCDPIELERRKWPKRGNDFVCPWMRCPTCRKELIWRSDDISQGLERLHCVDRDCLGTVPEDKIVLTRNRLTRLPPDILFTTTEILNQRLSDHWTRRLFGIGQHVDKKPLLALLDEVHTYEGATGAQAALTLRRWRHLMDKPVSWVGLSATLGDAAKFFSDLTGAELDRTVEITPSLDEYEEQGAEYQILLRGDPSSRASLLSSSIQTSMLLPRLLDPPGDANASGAFGRKAFLFTDDLDVTNRLFDDLRDAEGYTIFGNPDPLRLPLANLRRGGGDALLRDLEGQRWRICEDIGHPLDRRLTVGRTTSQDGGVNQSANIIVATAALEVGFNDPHVGAVVQHKAPRGMASFLQRKGRAGRDRSMRPFMVTVLSDYGRDRAFYQSFEHLFDPTLEPQTLPIHNPYVLKIQSVFAFFDWLADRTSGFEKAWQWDILSRPIQDTSSEVLTVISKTKSLVRELNQGDEAVIDDLRKYLVGALRVSRETADSLLWEAPRSLLLEAIPTLARRLFRKWELAIPTPEGALDLQVNYHPLPDFVPRSLFSDLALPEVSVIVPPATIKHEERIEGMPILQALNQFAPGRVTRRFAHERGALSHWVYLDKAVPLQDRLIKNYASKYEFVGTFAGRLNDLKSDEPICVYRPWEIRLVRVEQNEALPSSNAKLLWQSDVSENGDALAVPMPPQSHWRSHVVSIDFYLHRFRSSLNIRRFAHTVQANIRTSKDDFPVSLNFIDDQGRNAAVGFELEVDGLKMTVRLPTPDSLNLNSISSETLGPARLAYLRDTFRADPELPSEMNEFQRDWIFQFMTSVLIADAGATGHSIDQSISDVLEDSKLEANFGAVMDDMFGASPPSIPDHEEQEDEDGIHSSGNSLGRGVGRLQQALLQQLGNLEVRNRVRAIAQQMGKIDDIAFASWLRRVVLDTLGEAMLQACINSAPKHATVDNLLVDIEEGLGGDTANVWISETTIGGAGVLEAFAEKFTGDPSQFFSALDAALAPTDLELVDSSLREILSLSLNEQDIAEDLARLRGTQSHADRVSKWQSLSHRLTQRGGIDLSHALSVSLNNRLLRSGSGPELDHLLFDLQCLWDELEAKFGIGIGLREFGYIASKNSDISKKVDTFLRATLPAAAIGHVTILAAINSLLWPRAHEVRHRALQSYNPFRTARSTDPAVLRQLLLKQSIPIVELSEPDWESQLIRAFEQHGAGRLAADMKSVGLLRLHLVRLIASPVSIGVLQFFPTISRFERSSGRLLATLTLREQV